MIETDSNFATDSADHGSCAVAVCSACAGQYSKGYAAGRRRESDAICGQYVLRLRDGGEVIIRGVTVIDPQELARIQGWVSQQLIIEPNTTVEARRDAVASDGCSSPESPQTNEL